MRIRSAVASVAIAVAAATSLGVHAAAQRGMTDAGAAEGGVYTADSVHSSVIFSIRHGGVANFYGRFNKITGSFMIDEESPANSTFEFAVDLDSVMTGADGRDRHLKSPDFFNVAQFPEATFKSTSVRKTGTDTYAVKGDLSLHGVTKSIEATVKKTGEGMVRNTPAAGIEARFSIKRGDFDMTHYLAEDGGEDGGLGNTVNLIVAIEGKRG